MLTHKQKNNLETVFPFLLFSFSSFKRKLSTHVILKGKKGYCANKIQFVLYFIVPSKLGRKI